MVAEYNALLVLVAVVLLSMLVLVIMFPEFSTLAVIFVTYTNMAVIARNLYGVPDSVANAFGLLLGLPLVSYLIFQRRRLVFDQTFILMLVFLVAMLASSLVAVDKPRALNRVRDYLVEGLAFYILIINVIRNLPTLRRVIWTLLLAGSLLGALTLYQEVTHTYNNDFGGLVGRESQVVSGQVTQEGTVTTNRAGGPVDGDPNRFGQIMVVLLPLALFRIWGERSLWLRVAAACSFMLILGGMLLTYSRGAFVSFMLVLLIMTIMRYIRLRQILISVAGLAILILAAAPGYLARIDTIRGVEGLISQDSNQEPDYVTRGRLTEMMAALNVFLDYPVLGVGPGQYSKYYSIDYQLDPDIALRYIPNSRRAHTLYFEMGAETGIIGLTTFMIIVLLIIYRLWQARRRWIHSQPDIANMASALLISIIGYLGTAIFLHLSYQRYYWLLLALGGAAIQIFEPKVLSTAQLKETAAKRLSHLKQPVS
jgi:putative inorganic carbon (HCO3(-)) transporter